MEFTETAQEETTAQEEIIMIVDDNDNNLRLLSGMLMEKGYTVKSAISGALALRSVQVALPDLILLDIKMPDMDGYEVCRQLKADERSRDIPVVFISAMEEIKDKVKAFAVGGVDYITKPFQHEEVYARVATHMANRKMQERLKAQNTRLENEVMGRKKAQDELNKANEVLEQRVKERTSELTRTNEQLVLEIEEHGQAEDALRVSEERYRAIFEKAPVGIGLSNAMGKFISCNKALEDISGYIIDEAKDIDFSEIFTNSDDRQALLESLDRYGSVFNYPLQLKRKDNTHFDALLTLSRIHVGGENLFQSIVLDVSDLVQAQKEKKMLETHLQQAQKLEAIGTLAGGIAHDFNNILGAIFGYTEMARGNLPPESKQHAHLSEVLTAAHRAAELVKQILTISRKKEETLNPIQLRLIVKEALKLLRASLPSTIEIRQDLDADSDIVLADPTKIHQVVMNLCTNASHAMGEEGGLLELGLKCIDLDTVSVSRHQGLSPGPYLLLTVKDTGHGIPTDVVDRIFDPYFTTKKVGEGTGLGLSVVQGIVVVLGGMITVESEPGKGTLFSVFLPRIEIKRTTADETVETIPTGNERILFVDDEEALARMAQQLLEDLGYQVSIRTTSNEALEDFRADPDRYDLVITDMTMPHLTGDRLARELMKIRPEVPIILCTGYSKHISEEKAEWLGVKGFMEKPLLKSNLAKTIRRVLDDKGR